MYNILAQILLLNSLSFDVINNLKISTINLPMKIKSSTNIIKTLKNAF